MTETTPDEPWRARAPDGQPLFPRLAQMAEDPEGWDASHRTQPASASVDLDENWAAWQRLKRRAARWSRERDAGPSADLSDDYGPETLLLAVAVPLWLDRLLLLTPEARERRRVACLEALSYSNGVARLATGCPGGKGEVAETFNRLAEALALRALLPGSVFFAGMRFEAIRRTCEGP